MKKLKLITATFALLLGWSSAWAQKDITSQYITNANLSNGTTGWTVTRTNQTVNSHTAPDCFTSSTQGNNTTGYATEAYAGWDDLCQTAYTLKQSINLPAGSYRLVNYSFFRQGEAANTNASKSLAYLKAGDKGQIAIKTLGSITAAGYANSQTEGANVFDSKMYRNVVEFTVNEGGETIEIGIEGTFDEMRSWCIVGQFELFDLNDLASVSSPTDMTYAITNPGFEYRDLSGWTTSPDGAYWYPSDGNINNFAHIGNGWVESWAGNNFPNRSLSQTLTGLNNGLYEITVLAQGRGGNGFYLYGNADKTQITDRGDYSVRTTVTDGNLTIKVGTESFGGDWTPVDNFRLKFYGDPLAAYQDLLDAVVQTAQEYINSDPALSAKQIADLQSIVGDNDNDDDAFTEESQFNTAMETINNAVTTYKAMVTPYATFNALKASANAIAAVGYKETTSGSHATFATAITTQTSAADNATAASAITAAITSLKAAIKTYIAGAEPQNEGEYFDITCLMVNPNFEDSHNGWTYLSAPGVNWSNCEYYEKEFDINQTVTGLPTGSYSLSVQAFQRPGWAGTVYNEYIGGTDNASSVLYINSITSKVKNIAADAQASPKLDKVGDKNYGDWPYDSQVGSEGNYKYVPNSQEGAKLYFDAGLYDATCAAVVTNEDGGSLKLGFKSTKNHVSGDWTIFDNFRLYYYGSSQLVYYQQYWPQLKTEVSADLSNGAYANVFVSSEDEALDAALAATPSTESEYATAISNLTAAQTAFHNAALSYDAMVAAKSYAELTEITTNIGSGVFQYPTTTPSLYTAYTTAKSAVESYEFTTSSTAAGAQTLVDALDDAIAAYNDITLNEPAATDVFNVMITTGDDWAFKNEPLTFNKDNASGAFFAQSTGVKAYRAQQMIFTKVEGNKYKISTVDKDGNIVYMGTNKTINDQGGTNQIRLTTDATKALAIKVVPTAAEGVYNLLNTEDSNHKLGCQDNPAQQETGGIYTTDSHSDFNIIAATKPSVEINIASDVQFATRIFPFKPALPAGIKAYSIESAADGVITLAEVAAPAANTPYILYAEEGYTGDALTGFGTAVETTYAANNMTGVYEATTSQEGWYVLQNNGGKVGFYQVGAEVKPTIAANRCYFTGPSSARAFIFDMETTAINAINALTTGETEIYDLNGVKQNRLQKGINIVNKNGKTFKVMVK